MPDPLHHRRSIRLKEHDYSLPGAYFVTLCAAEKRCIFGHIIGHGMVENQTGKIVRKYWMEIPAHFPNAELDAFIVMPNHVHGILILRKSIQQVGSSGKEEFGKPSGISLAAIVRTFKAAVSRDARPSGMVPSPLWQRNYFERVLRDNKEHVEAVRYIMQNPWRWSVDAKNQQCVHTDLD